MADPRTRILILFAHPALNRSRINRKLAEAVVDLESVTFHDLYEAYPELDIDVEREQALLVDHEIIVFQFPLFWYSTPAILKEWQDLVLEHGWAYGTGGDALHGRKLLCATTTGGREEAYHTAGTNRFTLRELLAPIEQTSRLCGMDFLPPFVVHGTHLLSDEDIDRYAVDYRRLMAALRDGAIDLDHARGETLINDALPSLTVGGARS